MARPGPSRATVRRVVRLVRRAYIVCTEDRAIVADLQHDMIEKSGVDEVRYLPASHSPFLSMPGELADIILKL